MDRDVQDVFSDAAPPIVDGAIIEAAKENIRPIASGRRVTALAGILSTPHAQREALLASSHQRFRASITAALAEEPESGAEDPLSAYAAYAAWTVENYPEGYGTLLPLLEEATRVLKDRDGGKWRQDQRYLKLWAMYAGYVERPEIIWRFLLANDIGTDWAAMYEGFAAVLEREGKTKEADEIYLLGLARKVSPTDRLQAKHREFQKRMMAGILSPSASSSSDSTPALASATTSKRKVLGEMKRPSADDALPAPSPAPDVPRPNARMQVFVDEAAPSSPVLPSLAGAGASADGPPTNAWPELGTRVSRVKENMREVSKMAGTKLRQKPAARAASGSGSGASGRAGFAVFTDPDGENENPEPAPPPPRPAARAPSGSGLGAAGAGKKAAKPAASGFTIFADASSKEDMPPPPAPLKATGSSSSSSKIKALKPSSAGTGSAKTKLGDTAASKAAKTIKKPVVPAARNEDDDQEVAPALPQTPAPAKFVPFRDEACDEAPTPATFTPFQDDLASSGSPPRTSDTTAPGSVMRPKVAATPLSRGGSLSALGETDVGGTSAAASEAEALRKDPLKNYH